MDAYNVIISTAAFLDIQDATDWYDRRLPKLGSRFQKAVKQQINSLKKTPEIYNTRYQNVRCALVKKFPYSIHFKIDKGNRIVEVFAVIHTSRNPKIWDEKSLEPV